MFFLGYLSSKAIFGDGREYFAQLYTFVEKAQFGFVKGMMHRYAKDFCPEARIEERLSERQKILYEFD